MHINPNEKPHRVQEQQPLPFTSRLINVTGASNVTNQPETTVGSDYKILVTEDAQPTSTWCNFFSFADTKLSMKKSVVKNEDPAVKNKEIADSKVTKIRLMLEEQMNLVTVHHSKDNHLNLIISTVSDGKQQQQYLLTQLDNLAFSSKNFTEIKASSSSNLFIACFKEHSLEFSNRMGFCELRGEKLKSLLISFQFSSLRELFMKTYLTASDAYVICSLGCVKNALVSLIDDAKNDSNSADVAIMVLEQLKNEIYLSNPLSLYMPNIFLSLSNKKVE